MKKKINWFKVISVTGLVAMFIGILDPLEGSVIILVGSMLVSLSAYLTRDKYWKILLISFLLIATGVFFLFYLSSLGGFGGNSDLSWWYGALILPYPAGWITGIIFSIKSLAGKRKYKP